MFRRLLILCLLLNLSFAGCTAPQRTDGPEVVACEGDADPSEPSWWLPFGGADGQYGALMCACYALVLAAAAAGVWALAAADNWRDQLP
jgi:hypothetical protein